MVSPSNSWYIGKTVAADPTSTSHADSVLFNLPRGTGYSVFVFCRASPTDPWIDYGLSSGTFSVF